MTNSFENQPDVTQMFAEIQQGVKEESPASNIENTDGSQRHEQAVPYERFQQVNNERKEYEQKYTAMLEQLARQQSAQQGDSHEQAVQAGQQTAQQIRELLTPEETQWFNDNALIDPGGAMRQLSQVIYERGVKRETDRVKQELRQEFGTVAQQFAQQIAPMAINQFKQSAFNTPVAQQALPEFEALLQQELSVNPSVVNNPQALETLKTLAIGRAVESGKFNVAQRQPTTPFSENPGNHMAAFTPSQHTQVNTQAINIGQRLGISPEVIAKTHEVFERNGVYRNE